MGWVSFKLKWWVNFAKRRGIIDEIQKAPSLLTVVHSLIEQKIGIQFILTGSSARKLKRTSAESR